MTDTEYPRHFILYTYDVKNGWGGDSVYHVMVDKNKNMTEELGKAVEIMTVEYGCELENVTINELVNPMTIERTFSVKVVG